MMRWHISVFSADGALLIFAGQCRDRGEAETLASTARGMRPDVLIYLRAPDGAVSEWRA